MPPDCSAGKNLRTFSPILTAAVTCEGFTTPGTIGSPAAWAARTISGSNPGETRKSAPACCAAATCDSVRIVPAPIAMSGWAARIAAIDSSAHGLRSVTSIERTPPATSASASGTAAPAEGMAMTGRMPVSATRVSAPFG